ncbi:MAG: ribonuclease P protein component [Helicobacteraceae bacterium]|nr:ribonuclease P protein component [Helicobacteraceae bacterium]
MKQHREFQYVYKQSKSAHSNSCVLFYSSKSQINKVGFTATKKVGNAVKRNSCKRRFRALFKEYSSSLKDGKYIFVAKVAMNDVNYDVLKQDFEKVLTRLGGLVNDQKVAS